MIESIDFSKFAGKKGHDVWLEASNQANTLFPKFVGVFPQLEKFNKDYEFLLRFRCISPKTIPYGFFSFLSKNNLAYFWGKTKKIYPSDSLVYIRWEYLNYINDIILKNK